MICLLYYLKVTVSCLFPPLLFVKVVSDVGKVETFHGKTEAGFEILDVVVPLCFQKAPGMALP